MALMAAITIHAHHRKRIEIPSYSLLIHQFRQKSRMSFIIPMVKHHMCVCEVWIKLVSLNRKSFGLPLYLWNCIISYGSTIYIYWETVYIYWKLNIIIGTFNGFNYTRFLVQGQGNVEHRTKLFGRRDARSHQMFLPLMGSFYFFSSHQIFMPLIGSLQSKTNIFA